MEEVTTHTNILQRIKIPTKEMTSDIIQELLIKAKRAKIIDQTDLTQWTDIAEFLWMHLNEGLSKFDDQLLCATCFYSVLILLPRDKEVYFCNELLILFTKELANEESKLDKETSKVISLMYGMFQSSYLLKREKAKTLEDILQVTYKFLLVSAYKYSRFTYITFKTLSNFKKVCGTEMQKQLFSKENQVELLNLTCYNWENPITGVKDLNRNIFRTIMTVVDEAMYENILKEINGFYWNKAKFLMLAEIVETYNKNIIDLIDEQHLIEGLTYSLHKPGLVCAGADLYYAVFKKINSAETWCSIFLSPVMNILSGTSSKAIENFSNYWCLTTLKTYPDINATILNGLENIKCEHKLFSTLFVLKQANRLGIITKDFDSITFKERAVLEGLETTFYFSRMLAFEIMCMSQVKAMPTKEEYDHILMFIKNNVNSDCTVLRISMLNTFSNFLTQLHMAFLNYMKNDKGDMDNLETFCKQFQEVLADCLYVNGNYQRKITTLKLIKTFLDGLSEVPQKRQKQTRQLSTSIIATLREKDNCIVLGDDTIAKLLSLLNDPAEDVRETVIQLLLKHYHKELRNADIINSLIKQALMSMGSKFFYEISCGQSMFKLIVNLLIVENHADATFKTAEDVFDFARNELINEIATKRGVVEAIENGKQLHSFLSILHVVLEVSLPRSNNITITNSNIAELIDTVEKVLHEFAWDEENSTSSDFSKMSDMVQSIITKSGHSTEEDSTKISGLHQIVLNCLWLNVKASCDLLSLLIRYQKEDSQEAVCAKGLHLITHVLETCRHKGAIEAAGSALGQAIQHLTALSEDSTLSKLPLSLLQDKLKELITEADKMASVTRRGAGLSIMVHRIVSNDCARGKPLFHYFMKTLLETCKKTEDTPRERTNQEKESDNQKDLPKAIYIHFLTRIVTDSSLASDMMFYSAELGELAFHNLTSPIWQIRNAALQLYGALIPKLIGQKKPSGTTEETIATVAIDEFRTHSPKLWEHIQSRLKNTQFEDRVQYHSNLVPILSLIANSARRYNFSNDLNSDLDVDLLKCLFLLLDSPIYTVRRLAAQSICNIFFFREVYNHLKEQEFVSENFVHGSLMLLKNYTKCYGNIHKIEHDMKLTSMKLISKMKNGKHSYLSKQLYEEIFCANEIEESLLPETFKELKQNKYEPGVFLWAHSRLENVLKKAPLTRIPEVIEIILRESDNEHYLKFILEKLKNGPDIPKEILEEIAFTLMTYEKKFYSAVIWEILYQITFQVDLNDTLYSNFVNGLSDEDIKYKTRNLLPFAVAICRSNIANINEEKLLQLAKLIYKYTDPEVDIDIRNMATIANTELGKAFERLSESDRIVAIKSALILLQDEDEEIRTKSVDFFSYVSKSVRVQPYICLNKLVNMEFLKNILSSNGIEMLHRELLQFISDFVNSKSVDEYNPFSNDSKNIYLELEVFKQMIESLKIGID